MNSPDIAGFVEGDADHPPLASGAEGHAVGDTGRDAFAAGQFVQRNRHPWFQSARQADATALRVQHESVSCLGEIDCRVEARDTERELGADTGATPAGVDRFSRGLFVGGHDENVLMILLLES
jgi:hypothetical protein